MVAKHVQANEIGKWSCCSSGTNTNCTFRFVGFWLRTGSANEDATNNGASHFIEHMLFKGTERYSAREIAEAMDSIGGQLNAFTSREYTCYYARVLDEHLNLPFPS